MAQQIKKKFIKSDAIDGSKILLEANQTLRKKDGLGGEIDVIQNLKSYTDQKVSDLVNSAPEVLDTLKELSDALGGDANFAATVAGQIGAVDAKVDAEIIRAQAAESALQSQINALDNTFVSETELTAVVANLENQISAKLDKSGGKMTGILDMDSISIINLADPINPGDAAHKDYVDSKAAAEQSAREAADLTLQSNIDDLDGYAQEIRSDLDNLDGYAQEIRSDLDQEVIDRIAGDASTLTSAQSYTDQKVAALVNSAPEILDTLKELADALGNDANFATNVASQISALDVRLDVVEPKVSTLETKMDAVQSELVSLDQRLDILEAQTDGPVFYKMRIVIDESSELSYVDLNHDAITNSLVVAVGRLMAHLEEDFTVSVENGKTRLTWVGAFAQGGDEAIDFSDVIFVTYAVQA